VGLLCVVRIIVSNLPVDRDLHTDRRVVPRLLGVNAIEDRGLALGVAHAGFVVRNPVLLRLGAHVIEREGVRGVVRGHVCGDGAGAGGDDVRGARGTLCGAGEGEGAALGEAAAYREDDAEGHGGGEYGGHAGHDGLDGVVDPGGGHDKPEDHVREVDEQNGTVEVEAVAEHQLPRAKRLSLERVDGTHQSKTKRYGIEQRRSDPIDTDPIVFGTCDTALAVEERYRSVEAAGYGSGHYLNCKKGSHSKENGPIFVVDSVNPDDMNSRCSGEQDCSAYGLEEVEILACRLGPFGIEKCNRDNDELDGHENPQEMEQNLECGPARSLN